MLHGAHCCQINHPFSGKPRGQGVVTSHFLKLLLAAILKRGREQANLVPVILINTIYLWRHLKSVKTDAPISINVWMIDFSNKPHFRRVEWVSAKSRKTITIVSKTFLVF